VEDIELVDMGGAPFDTIIAADLIEHLVDPWRELRRWRGWVPEAAGSELVLSLPNLRYIRILFDLWWHGRFDYDPRGGLMDQTHLRWFTSRSLNRYLREAGWQAVRWGTTQARGRRIVNRIAGGRLDDFLVPQLQVVAKPARD
jgi:hypothetical protein